MLLHSRGLALAARSWVVDEKLMDDASAARTTVGLSSLGETLNSGVVEKRLLACWKLEAFTSLHFINRLLKCLSSYLSIISGIIPSSSFSTCFPDF